MLIYSFVALLTSSFVRVLSWILLTGFFAVINICCWEWKWQTSVSIWSLKKVLIVSLSSRLGARTEQYFIRGTFTTYSDQNWVTPCNAKQTGKPARILFPWCKEAYVLFDSNWNTIFDKSSSVIEPMISSIFMILIERNWNEWVRMEKKATT